MKYALQIIDLKSKNFATMKRYEELPTVSPTVFLLLKKKIIKIEFLSSQTNILSWVGIEKSKLNSHCHFFRLFYFFIKT